MNFRELSGDLVMLKNSSNLLLSTVNSSPTVESRDVLDTKKEIIPGIDSRKIEKQGKRLLTITGDVTDVP